MASFVHLCHAADVKRIRRAGIKIQKGRHGVYVVPATPDFYMSHQWLRELKRWRPGPVVAVYLRIPGNTRVLYGRYGGPHTEGSADEAVAALMQQDSKLGFETVLSRDVGPAEITRVTPMRPITGWRYYPTAKGREPCGCPMCQNPGERYSRRFRERFKAELG